MEKVFCMVWVISLKRKGGFVTNISATWHTGVAPGDCCMTAETWHCSVAWMWRKLMLTVSTKQSEGHWSSSSPHTNWKTRLEVSPLVPRFRRRRALWRTGKAVFLCLNPDDSFKCTYACPSWHWASTPMPYSSQTCSQLVLNLTGGKHGLEAAFPSAMASLSQMA